MKRITQFIGGAEVQPGADRWLDNVEPATGQVYSEVARGDTDDVRRAVDAAERAFPAWSALPAAARSRHLLDLADQIEKELERFARAESIDSGKPLSLARNVEIPRAVANFRFFATAILHDRSDAHVTETDDARALNLTLRRPRGVCGLISPWNLPLYLLSWKVAPALATGNTAVAKPSELTPMTAHLLAEACRQSGLPDGVLNIVHGLGAEAGAALTADPRIKTISFTGGTATGAEIARTTAPRFVKLALEMGGKNPTLIFDDADLEQALSETIRAAFSNQGQICLCGSRILVQRGIHDAFVEGLVERAARLRVGDPLEPDTEQGALVSQAHRDKVRGYIELAREEGGRVRCGGAPPTDLPDRCRGGFFLRPTIVTGLGPDCRVNQEEIFGPVATILPFDDEDEALSIANGTRYGLAASVWTENLTRAHRVADELESGTVWINCWLLRDLRVPFGGTKDSGVGREGGDEALRFFTEPKNVCLRLPFRKEDRA